jgi:hypothetical protein
VVIASKLIAMAEDGWELTFVSRSSESDAGKGDGQGIFVTFLNALNKTLRRLTSPP